MSLPRILLSLATALLLAGCSATPLDQTDDIDLATRMLGQPDAAAVALLQPVGGSLIEGKVTFMQFGQTVIVRANFIGLDPNRMYGLHVHERGDCRAAASGSTGGHFNPAGAAHGRPGTGAHHAGDLPNLQTDGEGGLVYLYRTRALSVGSGATGVVGRSVVLSRDPDDYRTQPDGNAGPPLACGFIRPA